MSLGILTDVTKCIGCERCIGACARENRLSPEIPYRWIAPDRLSAQRFNTVLHVEAKHHVRKHCRHCLKPACVSVCPVGALTRTEQGAIVYDEKICMGCRYCMMACPFGIPRYTWERNIPYVRKCNFCNARLSQGKQPACTEICPTGATIFGERDKLLLEAKKRLAAESRRYLPRIFGEHEIGGTAVIYLSPLDLSFLGLKQDLGDEPLPEITWRSLRTVPYVFLGMGTLMGGIYWMIERRRKLQGEKDDD